MSLGRTVMQLQLLLCHRQADFGSLFRALYQSKLLRNDCGARNDCQIPASPTCRGTKRSQV